MLSPGGKDRFLPINLLDDSPRNVRLIGLPSASISTISSEAVSSVRVSPSISTSRPSTLASSSSGLSAIRSITPSAKASLAERLAALVDEFGTFVGGTYLSWHRLLSAPPKEGTRPSQIHVCGAGLEACMIQADGGVGPCNAAPDYLCGNIRETDLASIWRDSPEMTLVRSLPQLTADDVEECRECPYRFQCCTGCRADAWSTTGSWTGGPASICWYRQD